MYLENFTNKRSTNLNLLKFFAACAVIISHSYPLSFGKNHVDYLNVISGNSLGLGGLAVAVFFLSSGYLVSKSIEKRGEKGYIKARILRIIPPLILSVIITILISGLFFSKLNFGSFILNIDTLKYCLNMLLIPIHNLPGVFEKNIYGSVVNGALWTLPVEFFCYIILLVFYKLKLLNKKSFRILIPIVLISYFFIIIAGDYYAILKLIMTYLQPMFVFFMGCVYYIYRDSIKVSNEQFIVNCLLFILCIYLKIGNIGTVLFFPYVLLYVSFCIKQCRTSFSKLGNISYGMYLCGFPIQQMVVSLFGGTMNEYLNMIISIPLSMIIGYIIYLLAEKNLKI